MWSTPMSWPLITATRLCLPILGLLVTSTTSSFSLPMPMFKRLAMSTTSMPMPIAMPMRKLQATWSTPMCKLLAMSTTWPTPTIKLLAT
ncbi:hypothetical protein BCR37DRAFT_381711 [Protomyces lactucae-debilis]|uniref:Uncharacterized protein n=1 Tax=Protomyces lactucae-debilis TaxID=2754530 RepID=A0A1Y2F6J5_PROLT|nr:uncharacterized protein BCR37DRAFT_381711 [Protomyces lactucae-debilis]ORY79518.1 hypothetical protein BCR37DRAFT_381711 [Protomyces lactucae-debilis]